MHFVRQSEIGKRNADAARIRQAKRISWAVFRTIILLGVGFIILRPVLFMLSMSLMTHIDIVNPAVVWIPRNWTIVNFTNALELLNFARAFRNSVQLGLGSALLQTISSALVGYGFARYKFFGRDFIFGLVILTLLVPPATVIVSQIVQMRFFDPLGLFSLFGLEPLNLLNTRSALYLPAFFGIGLRSGIFIYMFRQYFRGQPKELEDAARVDGCGHFGIFLRIMSPNAGSIYLTVFLFAVVWNWNDYYNSLMFTSQIQTLPTSLAIMRDTLRQASQVAHLGINAQDPYSQAANLMAGSFLNIAPVLFVYVVLQKFFTESVERSGIVG